MLLSFFCPSFRSQFSLFFQDKRASLKLSNISIREKNCDLVFLHFLSLSVARASWSFETSSPNYFGFPNIYVPLIFSLFQRQKKKRDSRKRFIKIGQTNHIAFFDFSFTSPLPKHLSNRETPPAPRPSPISSVSFFEIIHVDCGFPLIQQWRPIIPTKMPQSD